MGLMPDYPEGSHVLDAEGEQKKGLLTALLYCGTLDKALRLPGLQCTFLK